MVSTIAFLLIAGGILACAPVFKRVSKGVERLFVVLGFAVGIAVIAVTIDLALNLNLISSAPSASSNMYLKYYLIVMAVLGLLLFSRPLRNVRWASLIALGVGILAAAYLHAAFSVTSTTILGVVFIVTLLIIYTLLKFAEDILQFVGAVLAFPPIAVIIGLVSIYFGILTYSA